MITIKEKLYTLGLFLIWVIQFETVKVKIVEKKG